jgi:pectin methylesterase-like acyl-CoA thioesterase
LQNTHGNNGKAVAATIIGNNSAIFDCSFLGYQDTLWDALGRHYYKNCYIQGEVDFNFGQAQSYFEVIIIIIFVLHFLLCF